MAKDKKKYWLILSLAAFVFYLFIAAQPIPKETILVSRWLSSLESGYPSVLEPEPGGENAGDEGLLPFRLGNRFGYVDASGRFALNRPAAEKFSLSPSHWAEYGAIPETLEIRSPSGDGVITVEGGGAYPLFLDGRLFLASSDLTSITALDDEGKPRWTYDFAAVLSCVDAAAGCFLAGSLDGRVELLDSEGRLVFPPFEPGGSRLAGILGCSLSRDASRIAVISGVDDQRFLLLERSARTSPAGGTAGTAPGSGETYRVIYHEFLTDGFRRPVHVAFIDNDSRVAFEREGGLGIYDINSRSSVMLPLEGTIKGFDGSGGDGLFFVITSQSEEEKRLVGIRLPGRKVIEAPFKSKTAFLGRRGSRLYVGGGMTLASFTLGKK